MDRSPVAIVSVTTPPTLSAVTPFCPNDSRDTESYPAIAEAYDALALATTVRNDCR